MISTILIISALTVSSIGSLLMASTGLVYYSKYLTKQLKKQNEDKMNNVCNEIADKIEKK